VDDVVGEVKRDFVQPKIRVLDLFGEYDVAIAIVAGQLGGTIRAYGKLPDLKFLRSVSCFLNKCTDGISRGNLSLMGAQIFP
jgi:hypothetical protein